MVDDNFYYPDYCLVSRGDGTTDDKGNETFTPLYEGVCNIQYSQGGNTSLQGNTYQSTPTLVLPDNDSIFLINDMVLVRTRKGREINYSIEQFEDIEDEDVGGTTIWLKQGNDI